MKGQEALAGDREDHAARPPRESPANYRPAPKAEVRCDRCKYMFPPLALGGCRLVRGLIRGAATCDEFTPPALSSPERGDGGAGAQGKLGRCRTPNKQRHGTPRDLPR
jgi:hypothetical protein